MAALLHSLLYYAMKDGKFGFNKDQDQGQYFHIKSYGFAQPRPGNLEYSQDFSNITFRENNAIVVNNTIDVIPGIPLTVNLPHDTLQHLSRFKNVSKLAKYQIDELTNSDLITTVNDLTIKFDRKAQDLEHRLGLSDLVEKFNEVISRKGLDADSAKHLSDIKKYQDDHPAKLLLNFNYSLSGFLVPLIGHPDGQYDGQKLDDFIQHHAPTYRQLLKEKDLQWKKMRQ
jgi:hypothetical protein